MLYQLSYFRLLAFFKALWEVVDSNHRTLRERIYSPPQLPLCEPPNSLIFSISNTFRADRGIRTHDPEITNHVLWPTELYRQLNHPSSPKGTAKVDIFFDSANDFQEIFIISLRRSRMESESRPQSRRWESWRSCSTKRSGMPRPLMTGRLVRPAKYSLTAL